MHTQNFKLADNVFTFDQLSGQRGNLWIGKVIICEFGECRFNRVASKEWSWTRV